MRAVALSLFSATLTAAVVLSGCESSGSKAEEKPADAVPAATKDDAKPTPAKPDDKKPATPAGDAAASAATVEAKAIFSSRCTTCHGPAGKGDGPAAAGLNPKPRDYSDAAWQKSITDEELIKVILEGGTSVGKSALMPPNPDLKEKPEVVAEIVKMIRSFGG